jgi:hypothetical protein
MGIFEKLGLANKAQATIDWDITPALTFTIFESWGSKERNIRTKSERYYYFYIDSWQEPAKVCLMERGIKHARVMAEIDAPQEMIQRCISAQGEKAGLDKCYAVDEPLKQWLQDNILSGDCGDKVKLVGPDLEIEELDTGLPMKETPLPALKTVILPASSSVMNEDEVPGLIRKYGFFDSKYNPQGSFDTYLVDNGDGLTVTEKVTGVMWQRQGCDINSIRQVQAYLAGINQNGFAGFSDWRLPALEEAMSLMQPTPNAKEQYLHPCFSHHQPFIFVSQQRQPGGYWFVDYKQATVFWASGTNPGGFGRLCRRA